jgi:hypothetical protein
MAFVFPTFNNGVVTQLPYAETAPIYYVTQSYMPCGFTYPMVWNQTQPQMRFDVRFDCMQQTEQQALEAFWESVEGQLGYFSFTDDNGVIHSQCRFDQPSLEWQYPEAGCYAIQVRILALN